MIYRLRVSVYDTNEKIIRTDRDKNEIIRDKKLRRITPPLNSKFEKIMIDTLTISTFFIMLRVTLR